MTMLHAGADAPGPASPTPGMRRGTFRTFVTVVTIAMMLVGGIALASPAAMADADADAPPTRTTDDLNLRAAPALNAEILTVIPVGATVAVTGGGEGGFFAVSFEGQEGFAYGAYLTGVDDANGPVTTGGQEGEVNVADGPVNFRTGPSTDDPVISVIPNGALVALTGDSANGFLSIIYSDRAGWAHAASVLGTTDAPAPPAGQPLAPEPQEGDSPGVPVGDEVTGIATVIDGGLNLRSGPSTSDDVLLTMPEGALVELRGDPQNGFLPVSHEGTTGWAFAEFLQVAGAGEEPAPPPTEEPEDAPAPTEAPEPTEEPAAPPVDGSDGYTEDELIQIIQDAAALYGQDGGDMLRVARCESVLDPDAVNATSGAAGLFQFLPDTWETTPYADQDIFDPVANAEAAAWMWENGRRGEWTCQ